MKSTPEDQAKQDRAHLRVALQGLQDAHNLLCCGHPNPYEARHVLKTRATAIHEYLKAHPEDPIPTVDRVDYVWDIEGPEGIEEAAV